MLFRSLHEGIHTGESQGLTCTKQFAPQVLVDDRRHQHGVATLKPLDEPAVHRHGLWGYFRLRHRPERAGIQQKIATYGKAGLSCGRFALSAALNSASSCSAWEIAA